MKNVVKLTDYAPWSVLFEHSNDYTKVMLYINDRTSEIDVVQLTTDGKSITTNLSTVQAVMLYEKLRKIYENP